MSAGRLLNQRAISRLVNCPGTKEELWANVSRLGPASARADLIQTKQQQQQQLHQQVRQCSSSASRAPLRQLSATDGRLKIKQQQQQQQQHQQTRYTSTTAPTASSIPSSAGKASIVAVKAAGPSSPSIATSSIAATGVRSKRDASTQAKHQRQLIQLDEQPLQWAQQQHKVQPDFGNDDFDEEPAVDPFRSSDLVTLQCSPGDLQPKPSVNELLFGHTFTDHMFQVEWNLEKGWSTPLITKLHNLEIHPGSKALHYAVQAFEGAKAFRGHDNKIRFFRLDQNIKRLLRSSRRLALPDFDERELVKCIHKLVELDQDWIPESRPDQQQLASLYIRPTIMGMEPSLGVARSRKSLLYVLLSPVGPYFKTGFRPISLYADPDFVRAWPGGAGSAKLGANYAPTIMVQRRAEKLGLQQVLWLYGDDLKLTEVGTMNIFVSMLNKETGKVHLVTPPLSDGLVLPGITRSSILDLVRRWGDVICEERYITMGEIEQLINDGTLIEMFGAGTACVVCPISSVQIKNGKRLDIPYVDVTNEQTLNQPGQLFLTKRILQTITDIQYGRVPHHWAQELETS